MTTTTTNSATATETTTLYLNGDARLGDRVIGDADDFAPMLSDGESVTDFDVAEFTTLAELLTHLMTNNSRIHTIEDACREFLSLPGSEMVEKIA